MLDRAGPWKCRIDDDTASSLDPSVQSLSRTSQQQSPVQDLLNKLPLSSPSIHCTRPKSVPLPNSVLSLQQALGRNFGSKVIPAPLKDKIYADAREEALDIPDAVFDSTANLTPEELDALWHDVREI
ncbi:hypothetical protein BJX76DRAFT_344290 [Aspergillus varians]